jgi:D-serine deaminase-like pyridoxal phosphate-dependent protein
VACPVVSVFPQREEMVIYGGAIHLSKEFIAADNNFKLFGYLVKFEHGKWGLPINGAWVSGLSQEHGIIRMPKKELEQFKPGDLIGVIPVHSCLTANLLQSNSVLL